MRSHSDRFLASREPSNFGSMKVKRWPKKSAPTPRSAACNQSTTHIGMRNLGALKSGDNGKRICTMRVRQRQCPSRSVRHGAASDVSHMVTGFMLVVCWKSEKVLTGYPISGDHGFYGVASQGLLRLPFPSRVRALPRFLIMTFPRMNCRHQVWSLTTRRPTRGSSKE